MSEMNLNVVGTSQVKINEAFVAEKNTYDDSVFEVAVVVEDSIGTQKHWIGSFSNNYGRGNFSDRTQTQITLQKLAELGLQDNDLQNLDSLVGALTTATTKASQCGKYVNISYLGGGGNKPKPMAKDRVAELAAQIKGNVTTEVPAVEVVPAANEVVPAANPFLA